LNALRRWPNVKGFLRWFGHAAVWAGPALVLLLAVVCGFLTWTLTTEQGARWLLASVARQFEGQAHDVHGSVLRGLRVGSLELSLPDAAVQARDVWLDVDWVALRERRLRVRHVSAQEVWLVVNPENPENPETAPPLSLDPIDLMRWLLGLELDALRLGRLDVRVNGRANDEAFFLRVDAVELAANLTRAGELDVRRLALERAEARIDGAPLPLRLDAVELTATLADLTGARGSATVHRLALEHDLIRVAVQGDTIWELEGLALHTVDVDMRLLELRARDETLPLRVDALELAAHLTRTSGSVILRKLALAHALGDVALQADATWELGARDAGLNVEAVNLNAQLLDGARWNGQPLTGMLRAQARHASSHVPSAALHDVVQDWTLPNLALDLRLGNNHVVLNGALGQAADRLKLKADLPTFTEFLPQLAGGLRVQGEVGGSAARHLVELEAVFTPADESIPTLDQTPVQATLALTGAWERPGARDQTWRARITQLQVAHATLNVGVEKPLTLDWQPQSPDREWTLGAAPLRLSLAQQHQFTLDHRQSTFGGGRWETRGGIAQLHLTDANIAQWRQVLGLANPFASVSGDGTHDTTHTTRTTQPGSDVHLATDWHLRFTDTLEGQWNVHRSAGDLVIPWEPPVPVGLRDFTLNVNAARISAGRSQLRASATIDTQAMGSLRLQASTRLRGDWRLDTPDATVIEAQSDMADLGWLSLFNALPVEVELGGAITAQIKAQHRADGSWTTQGRVTGQGLRIVYPDEGVRLLDGTLAARFDGERFVLEQLRFPARLRVEPRERRTREWVARDPDTQNGSLTIRGDWRLRDDVGNIQVALHRYPLLQRADRHAMFSGAVQVDAALDASKIIVTGALTADAGWFDLDIISGVPELDNDVVVHRAGDAAATAKLASPTEVEMDVTLDLGSRFYLTGYGLDSVLQGKLRLRMQDGRLRADGALNTRGGTVSAYGQQLRLFRGNVTFQGDVMSPVLDIVAMRSGDAAVRAGVRVAGTARRPRIDLVSTPEVNDVEKLSWLLLGRESDNAGADAALLLSVGSSFFTGGEPFYRQFGLDELGMRSGALGATGSLLPVESVVRNLDAGVSDVERQFIVASKNVSQGFTVSVEQALSDTGTVGRISYRLARGLNASLSVGTVNGLALIYRWFSRDD